ncbi:hypothetical protein LIER_12335 [Lithospermum erythrorhizon]|uniref:RNase H type-1 domain-containing protein n=1 Tax=Lithospermum erythrorhizon TaxID=34254 RepID=A0AAV3PTD2_LITER
MDQVKGVCGVKHEPLVKYHMNVIQQPKGFKKVIFEHIPHAQNVEADHLSRLATTYYDELPRGVYVKVREVPAYEEVQHQSTTYMTPILNPIPFAMWGMDLVGKFPKAMGSLEYAVVAVDYFSKRVEDAPLKETGSDIIVRFL